MNRAEIAQLLTVIGALDRRTLGEADVIAWHGTLGDLLFEECRDAAVKHYAEQTEWLMPAHIRRRVLARRQDAAMRELPSGTGDLITKPDWFATTAEQHKLRTREDNRLRKERGERPYFGETVTRPGDHRPSR